MEFVPCGNCIDGYIEHGDTVEPCSCRIEYQLKVKTMEGLKKAGISHLDYDILIDNYLGPDEAGNIPKIKKYISEYRTRFYENSSLYFYGTNGTQKTTMAKYVLKEVIKQGFSGKFILMGTLMDILTDTFEKENPLIIKEYLMCDLLVIDDAMADNKVVLYKSGYQIPFLDKFLRERLETLRKNIIFTSNVAINKIKTDKFSKDIQDLLERNISMKKGELQFNDSYKGYLESFDDMWG
jgi:DNA replication protein DnaC